jgi:hypothetical protein
VRRAFLLTAVAACAGKPAEPRPTPPPAQRLVDARAANAAPAPLDAAVPDAADTTPLTFAAVGDLMLGSTYPDTSGGALPPDDGATLLAEVAPILGAADVAFGNLEGPLFDGGDHPTCSPGGIAERNHGRRGGTRCWSFRMPARYGALLRDAGFDVVSIANNHIDDFGADGRAGTIAELDRLGIAHSGPVGTVAHLTVRGHAVDVIAFATYPGLNDSLDLDAARGLVEASAATGAITVVSFHGGAEGAKAQHLRGDRHETFFTEDRGAPPVFARAMVDAGADLVLGHGPHVLRALEIYQGRLIAYSLGTFATYRGIGVKDVLGVTMILEVTLGLDGGFVAGRIDAVRQTPPGGPRLDADGAAIANVRALSADDVGAAAPTIGDDGTILPP